MPVTFAPGWVPSPSTGASVFGGIASGIQNALETYRTFKKDKEEHDFRVQEMALRSQEAEARRAEQAQLQQIRQHQLEREQTEEGIQTEGERAALGIENQQQKEIGDLGSMISEATKTGFVAPQMQTQTPTLGDVMKSIKQQNPKVPVPTMPALETPPQGALASMISPSAFTQQPQAPLSSMVAPQITAPEIAPATTAVQKLATSEQAATQAAAAPSGPLSIAQRAAGRKAIANQEFQRQVGERERQENVTFEKQRQLFEHQNEVEAERTRRAEGIADKRFAQALQVAGIRANAAGGGASGNIHPDLDGPELLAALDPQTRSTVQGLIDGRVDPKTMSNRNNRREFVIDLANRVSGNTYSMQDYATKMNTKREFTVGKAAQNVRSLNTVMGHLDQFREKADALNNRGLQFWNKVANAGLTATGDSAVTNFEKAANAVESELASLFKGTGATDQEIHAWRQTLNSSQSPKQLQDGVKELVRLVESRMEALQSQYKQGLAGDLTVSGLLTPKSKEIYERLSGRQIEGAGNEAAGAGGSGGGKQSGPPVGTVLNGYRFKGGDPNAQSSWEKVK